MMSPSVGATKSQQYCLRWNNHQSNLLCNFSRLLSSDAFTDVLLAAEGRTLRAHKVVLSACSAYFETLFTSFDQPKQIVILKDTPFEDAEAIVEFMYKGEVNIAQTQLPSLLRTAENLKVKGLAEVEASPTPDSLASLEQVSPLSLTPTSNGKSYQSKTPGYAKGMDMSSKPSTSGTGEVKRKRGRPRLLDSPGETPDPCFTTVTKQHTSNNNSNSSSSTPSAVKAPRVSTSAPGMASATATALAEADFAAAMYLDHALSGPTPGGPLTPDRIDTLGIVKMGDYLSAGTRQQFWEEYYVKVIMQAVRNKEVDMKGAAELLGVSYGTLYGRYRETFGYLKHSWNLSGRTTSSGSSSSTAPAVTTTAAAASAAAHNPYLSLTAGLKVEPGLSDIISDHEAIFEQLRAGRITVKQAGALLGIDPSMLAFQLTGKINPSDFLEEPLEDPIAAPNEDNDPRQQETSNSGEEDSGGDNNQASPVQPDYEVKASAKV